MSAPVLGSVYSNGKLFYMDLIHTRSYNLFRLRDLNATAPYPLDDPANVRVRTQAEADATRYAF